jgi:hypothetical protein
MLHPVFVPKPLTFAHTVIVKGSAIVGKSLDENGFVIYYEGNLFKAANIITFEDKAMLAAGRMEEHYPTVAKMYCQSIDLINVGHFESATNTFTANDIPQAIQALSDWLEVR